MDLTFIFIFLNFVFFTLSQLVSISKDSGLNIYFFDIFLVFTNIFLFVKLVKRGKFILNFPLLVFSLFFIFSLVFTFFQIYFFSFIEQIKIQSYLFRFSGYFFFGYLMFLSLRYELLSLEKLKVVLINNFYLLTFLNIIQMIFFNDLTNLAQFGWDPHIGRLTGTFLDPNFMAFYLCLYFLLNNFVLKNKYIEYISIFSIFLTLSRNGILTFLIVYLLINYKNLFKLAAILFVSLLIIFINPRIIERFIQFSDSNDSSYLRIISWTEALDLFSFNNYSGIGFNNYRNSLELYRISDLSNLSRNSSNSTDSSFLLVFVTLGGVGFILIVLLFIGFVLPGKFVYFNFLIVLSLMFNSLFINSLFYPQISILIFVSLFLGIYLKNTD